MSLVALFMGKGPNGFGNGSTAEEVTEGLDLSGKTYLLTGCNSGIGLESLRVLGLRGAHVIAAARTEDKARAALEQTGTAGTPVACELSEPASVRAAVEQVRALRRPLDAILCNAGIMALPKRELQHGYEAQFFTNHIGHFILVTGLLDQLTSDGRVVMVSSSAHRTAPAQGIEFDNLDASKSYGAFRNYGQAKLANLLFARQLARRFQGSGRTAFAVHPGVIPTNLARHMNPVAAVGMAVVAPLFMKSAAQGAATQIYVATGSVDPSQSGSYFADCNPARPARQGQDDALAEKLWQVSEQIAASV
ncbi:MAG: SDR family oxidoreductase [Pseudomonadota bacterium]